MKMDAAPLLVVTLVHLVQPVPPRTRLRGHVLVNNVIVDFVTKRRKVVVSSTQVITTASPTTRLIPAVIVT
jgi:hypothetical protein